MGVGVMFNLVFNVSSHITATQIYVSYVIVVLNGVVCKFFVDTAFSLY